MVSDLVQRARGETMIKHVLGLDGEMEFQDHTNLGDEGNAEPAKAMHDLRLQQNAKRTARKQSPYRHRGTADQFCILKSNEDGSRRPVVAIEYKAPHKLTPHTVALGLKTEVDTYEDVISQTQEPEDDTKKNVWWCRYVMVAVVTQLFSYMIAQGTRYGYICTGQAYVFLRIGDDPSNVYYSIHIPNRDFDENDPWRVHQTAVARISAFILQAAPEAGPTQAWHRKRECLSPWKVDIQSVIHQMPDSIRTDTSDSDYLPNRYVLHKRSPILIRARCRPDEDQQPSGDDGSGSDAEGRYDPESPSQQRQTRQARARDLQSSMGQQVPNTGEERHRRQAQEHGHIRRIGIKDRPYCTHTCLLGLGHRGDMDPGCPNARFHRAKHPAKAEFLELVKQQLLVDTGNDADCIPLEIHGARGGLLKICLTSLGYTFVAKGMEQHHVQRLRHERRVYSQLLPLQGEKVPVCLGIAKLWQVYYYSGAQLSHLLLMSWGGHPLLAPTNKQYRLCFPKMAEKALAAAHHLQVLHRDAQPRNMLFDANRMKLMLIDFERSELFRRQALSSISPNALLSQKRWDNSCRFSTPFDEELRAACNYLSNWR